MMLVWLSDGIFNEMMMYNIIENSHNSQQSSSSVCTKSSKWSWKYKWPVIIFCGKGFSTAKKKYECICDWNDARTW